MGSHISSLLKCLSVHLILLQHSRLLTETAKNTKSTKQRPILKINPYNPNTCISGRIYPHACGCILLHFYRSSENVFGRYYILPPNNKNNFINFQIQVIFGQYTKLQTRFQNIWKDVSLFGFATLIKFDWSSNFRPLVTF